MENTVFFQWKSWWKDDIYLVFLSFPWYFGTWEIWFFVQWVKESLEIDMTVLRNWQGKVLNRDNGNFVKTNAWKPLFKKMKTLHWNLTSFCIRWQFSVVLSSVWKWLQLVRPKYHILSNKTFVVLLANFDVSYLSLFNIVGTIIDVFKTTRDDRWISHKLTSKPGIDCERTSVTSREDKSCSKHFLLSFLGKKVQ